MTDLGPTTPAPDTAPSTQLAPAQGTPNPTSFKPEAAPEPKPEAAKPLTARQALEKAAADVKIDGAKPAEPKAPEPKAAEAKPEAKVEAAPKAEQPRENGKFVAANQEQQPSSASTAEVAGEGNREGVSERGPSEGNSSSEPPRNFLPRAREEWGNTPDAVRSEVHRLVQNFENGKAQYEEDRTFRKELREFEDMAKASGTTVKQAIENYVAIDQQLRQNPVAALERILHSVGITPQQYAQHVLGQAQQQAQNPNHAPMQQMQRQIEQMAQTIQQLTQGSQQDREAARLAEVQRTIIEPFKASHPRYEELSGDIAFFLNSDKIPSTLSEHQRLETAYDMAERINPAPHQAAQTRLTAAPPQKPINPAGDRSIKGTPIPGTNLAGDKGKLSPRDAIRAAAAEHGIPM